MTAFDWLQAAAKALGLALKPFLEKVATAIPDLAGPIAELLEKIASAAPWEDLEPLAEEIKQELLAIATAKIISKFHPSSFA